MLEITSCFELPVVAGYCKKCGRMPSEAHFLYLAREGENIVAAGLFEVGSDRVSAVYYESSMEWDHHLFDAVLRAGLNYASKQGVESGYLPEDFRSLHAKAFAELNYPAQSLFNITNFFGKYKNICT